MGTAEVPLFFRGSGIGPLGPTLPLCAKLKRRCRDYGCSARRILVTDDLLRRQRNVTLTLLVEISHLPLMSSLHLLCGNRQRRLLLFCSSPAS